jgi:predicted nuclease of predicted toxin-antitoxin system
MKLLADENFPRPAITRLRAAGFAVEEAVAGSRGIPDEEILQLAQIGGRVLLTLDKDFGELIWARRQTGQAGVLLFRLKTATLAEFVDRVVQAVRSRNDWTGCFAVITNDKIRLRRLSE